MTPRCPKTVSNDTNLGRVGGHSSQRSFMFRCLTLLLLEITAGAGVSPVIRKQLRVRWRQPAPPRREKISGAHRQAPRLRSRRSPNRPSERWSERRYCARKFNNSRHFRARPLTFVRVWLRRFIGYSLVGLGMLRPSYIKPLPLQGRAFPSKSVPFTQERS